MFEQADAKLKHAW